MPPRFESTSNPPLSTHHDVDDDEHASNIGMTSSLANRYSLSSTSNVNKLEPSSLLSGSENQSNTTIERHMSVSTDHLQHGLPLYPSGNIPLIPLNSNGNSSSSIAGYSKYYGNSSGNVIPSNAIHSVNSTGYITPHSSHGPPSHHINHQNHPMYQGRYQSKYTQNLTPGNSNSMPGSVASKGHIDGLLSALQSEYDFLIKENGHFRKQQEEMELKIKHSIAEMASLQKIIVDMELLLFKLHKSFDEDINRCKQELNQKGYSFTFKTSALVETFFKNFSSAVNQGSSNHDLNNPAQLTHGIHPVPLTLNAMHQHPSSYSNQTSAIKSIHVPSHLVVQNSEHKTSSNSMKNNNSQDKNTSEKRARLSISLPSQKPLILEYFNIRATETLPEWSHWSWPEGNPYKVVSLKPSINFNLQYKDIISSLRWSYSGKYYAFGSYKSTQLYDSESRTLLKEYTCDLVESTENTVGSFIRTIDFHPSSSFFAAGSENKLIYIFSCDQAKSSSPIQIINHHMQDIYCIKYSPVGNYLASVSGDSKITIWDVNSSSGKHKLIKEISVFSNPDPDISTTDTENKDFIISCVCWSGDGQYLFVASLGSSLYTINVELGTVSYHPSGHSASIYHLNLSVDSTKLASASLDKTIRVWQISSDKNQQLTLTSCLAILEGHQDYVLSVCFSWDSRFIISSSKDTFIIVWCANTFTLLCKIASYKNSVLCIDSHPKQPYVLSGSGDSRVSIWDLSLF